MKYSSAWPCAGPCLLPAWHLFAESPNPVELSRGPTAAEAASVLWTSLSVTAAEQGQCTSSSAHRLHTPRCGRGRGRGRADVGSSLCRLPPRRTPGGALSTGGANSTPQMLANCCTVSCSNGTFSRSHHQRASVLIFLCLADIFSVF